MISINPKLNLKLFKDINPTGHLDVSVRSICDRYINCKVRIIYIPMNLAEKMPNSKIVIDRIVPTKFI